MGMADHKTSVKVPYSADNTFEALKQCCKYLYGMKVKSVDDLLKTVYLKAGVSAFSWGENITVTVKAAEDGETIVEIVSASKTGALGGALDMGKNNKNLKSIMDELSMELKKYPQIKKESANLSSGSIADEIKKYAELKNQGLLTEEEFTAKKKQLLGI